MAGTTLTAFQARLVGPLGRNDTTGNSFLTQGINFGCVMVALLFDPPDLHTSGSLTIALSGTSVTLTSLTRLRVIRSIYNTTSSKQMFSIPFERLAFVAPTETGASRFYSREGSTLHVRPAASTSNSLTCYYSQFPLVLSSGSDVCSIEYHDSMIESYALTYAMGCLEELEAGAFWQKMGEQLLVPEQLLMQARQYLEGGPSGYNTKRTA